LYISQDEAMRAAQDALAKRKQSAISSRLGLPSDPTSKPVGKVPAPKATPAQNPTAPSGYMRRGEWTPTATPDFGKKPTTPATSTKDTAVAPGTPSVGTAKLLEELQKDPEDEYRRAHPIMSAIGRALTGFSRGMENVPAGTAYDPWLGGITGGLAATGKSIEAERARRMESGKPGRELLTKLAQSALEQKLVKGPAKTEEREAELESWKTKEGIRTSNRRDLATQAAGAKIAARADLTPAEKIAAHKLAKQELETMMPLVDYMDPKKWSAAYDDRVDKLLASLKKSAPGSTAPLQEEAPEGGEDMSYLWE